MALQREEDRVEQKSAEVGELQRRLLGMETVMVTFRLQGPALGPRTAFSSSSIASLLSSHAHSF